MLERFFIFGGGEVEGELGESVEKVEVHLGFEVK